MEAFSGREAFGGRLTRVREGSFSARRHNTPRRQLEHQSTTLDVDDAFRRGDYSYT